MTHSIKNSLAFKHSVEVTTGRYLGITSEDKEVVSQIITKIQLSSGMRHSDVLSLTLGDLISAGGAKK